MRAGEGSDGPAPGTGPSPGRIAHPDCQHRPDSAARTAPARPGLSLARKPSYKPAARGSSATGPRPWQRSPVPRPVLHSLFALASGLLAVGCDVRDEQARSGPADAWLETTAMRLASPTATLVDRPANSAVECCDGFETGARRASEAGLPLLLVFRASWCRWSADLVDAVLADERLASAGGRFVCASIDADRDAATCRSFGVSAFPTVIVLDAERREQFRASGAAARQGLAAALEGVLARPRSRVARTPSATAARE